MQLKMIIFKEQKYIGGNEDNLTRQFIDFLFNGHTSKKGSNVDSVLMYTLPKCLDVKVSFLMIEN